MRRLAVISGSIVLAATACASSGGNKNAGQVTAAPVGAGDIIVGALPEPAVPKGECGMVLWTLESDQPTPIFRFVAGKGADIVLNGKLTPLSATDSDGVSGFGVYEETRYVAGDVAATVKVRFGLGFEGGSYLERGLLTIETASGWKSVIPAAGIAGCRVR